jgi:hypothetical protein
MKLSWRRSRALGIAVASSAAVAALAAAGPGFAAAAAPASPSVVIFNCNIAKVKPSAVTLACADGGAGLTKLHWVSWKAGEAFATGTEYVNDCNPYCAAGKIYTYPTLVTAWRPEPRPGHSAQDYFSRITLIHTGSLRRPHAGKLPLTQTYNLPLPF